ncbi:MAG TPA: alpha/beta hydrolase [Acidimicrobiales bacterium]|nr:alpha/beta hydrolase [Acidimicrobiales bacterium]
MAVTATVTLPDGRELAYEEYGDPAGFPVLSFHGGLSSRLDAAPAQGAALAGGVRLLSPDRPGIGRSTFQPGRRLLDWPADVAHLTDALGIDHFAVMGWSAGGPYAAACAAKMGERVTAAALLSSAVPLDLYGTTKGLSASDRALLFLTRRTPGLASAVLKASVVNASNARLLHAALRSFPPADRTVLREWGPPDFALAFVREAVRQGTEGCVQDYRIFGDPWGFALEEIRVPVQIWEGSDDQTGPPGYRAFLQRHIAHSTITVVPGEGHLSLLPHQAPAIFAALLGDHNAESTAGSSTG